jgi:hypothetical protein
VVTTASNCFSKEVVATLRDYLYMGERTDAEMKEVGQTLNPKPWVVQVDTALIPCGHCLVSALETNM